VNNNDSTTNGGDSKTDVAGLLKGDTLAIEKQAVNGKRLLEILFPPDSRPTHRWLQKQQQLRRIPFVKIGKCVWFFPDQVREAMIQRFTIKQRGV
jgi:hypothetical protein